MLILNHGYFLMSDIRYIRTIFWLFAKNNKQKICLCRAGCHPKIKVKLFGENKKRRRRMVIRPPSKMGDANEILSLCLVFLQPLYCTTYMCLPYDLLLLNVSRLRSDITPLSCISFLTEIITGRASLKCSNLDGLFLLKFLCFRF